MKKNQVYFFDTTLRDGQQSPGAGMSFEDNLLYADYADAMHIDVLEAGFPSASKTDFDIVQTIAERMNDKSSDMIVSGLCQLREEQCVKTMQALEPCLRRGKARVHTYVPVDPNLMQASLGSLANQPDKIIASLEKNIAMAVQAGYQVEFSPEGYSRMGNNFDFTTDCIRAAVSAGATVINCPDTIGGASRYEGDNYFVKHMQRHADIMQAEFPDRELIWSTHCHNDFGLAMDNSIAAVFDGPARQIEGCINGVGERAGNADLGLCLVFINAFGDRVKPGETFFTGLDSKKLKQISDFIAEKMLPRQPHTPVVGDNAARHTSGGHTNAILHNPLAYQPFDPSSTGHEISFVFGPLSGGNHAKKIIEANGYECSDAEKAEIAQFIKDYYKDRRKGITDKELITAYLAFRER